MKYTSDSFLKQDSDFKYILYMMEDFNKHVCINSIKEYSGSIENIDGNFLPLALKAMDLSNIVFFLNDGKTFFDNFRLISTYDGFVGILKSLFLSEDIKIINKSGGVIDIKLTNKNESLISNYTDAQKALYKDNFDFYLGFKSDNSSSLENFFKIFLQKFLPTGVVLNSIKINSFIELLKQEKSTNKNKRTTKKVNEKKNGK